MINENFKLLLVIGATVLDSLFAFVGALTLFFKKRQFEKIIHALISFAAGVLLGGSFFHILPEILEEKDPFFVFLLVVLGFSSFFLAERFLWWHHCHEEKCDAHPFSYLILWSDGFHNFIDGIVIGVSFLADIKLGILTTFLILAHEVPQELSDFGVLIYGGFTPKKALFYNFLSQVSCILGGLLGYLFRLPFDPAIFVLPFAAGGFIYIATSDLIPEIHKEMNKKRSFVSFLIFLGGLFLMLSFKFLMH